MIINDSNINSNIELLGNSAKTVGDYLNELYPDSSSTYALEQLASGDNGSQSIIITSGGTYEQDKSVLLPLHIARGSHYLIYWFKFISNNFTTERI